MKPSEAMLAGAELVTSTGYRYKIINKKDVYCVSPQMPEKYNITGYYIKDFDNGNFIIDWSEAVNKSIQEVLDETE